MIPEMVITDLDGTFLNSAGQISAVNRKTMEELAESNIITVFATGRSLYSYQQVIPASLPVDFIVFSSGAGIYECRTKKIVDSNTIDSGFVKQSVNVLHRHRIDFFIHREIPENHFFDYFLFDNSNKTDAWQRIKNYNEFATPINNISNYNFSNSCQVIGITQNVPELCDSIKLELPYLNVIRTTSPLDKESLWIEIFPKQVSKAKACRKLCKLLGVKRNKTLGIGNDFNDLDMLNWVAQSYVVGNAPKKLTKQFPRIETNDNDGFSKLIKNII